MWVCLSGKNPYTIGNTANSKNDSDCCHCCHQCVSLDQEIQHYTLMLRAVALGKKFWDWEFF